MSQYVRHAILVVAAMIVVLPGVARLQRPPAGPSSAAAAQVHVPFPARLTATSSPLPQFAESPIARVRQQLASVETMWSRVFGATRQASYEKVTLVEQSGAGECGGGTEGWAGVYCPATQTIVIDLGAHTRRHAAVGQGLSDLVLGYIVAHEVGHHVQTLRGAPLHDSLDVTVRRELHADCLAGVWGKAAGLALPPTWAYGVDAEHGTMQQRIVWLNRGYAHARPADCDAIWSGAAL